MLENQAPWAKKKKEIALKWMSQLMDQTGGNHALNMATSGATLICTSWKSGPKLFYSFRRESTANCKEKHKRYQGWYLKTIYRNNCSAPGPGLPSPGHIWFRPGSHAWHTILGSTAWVVLQHFPHLSFANHERIKTSFSGGHQPDLCKMDLQWPCFSIKCLSK